MWSDVVSMGLSARFTAQPQRPSRSGSLITCCGFAFALSQLGNLFTRGRVATRWTDNSTMKRNSLDRDSATATDPPINTNQHLNPPTLLFSLYRRSFKHLTATGEIRDIGTDTTCLLQLLLALGAVLPRTRQPLLLRGQPVLVSSRPAVRLQGRQMNSHRRRLVLQGD